MPNPVITKRLGVSELAWDPEVLDWYARVLANSGTVGNTTLRAVNLFMHQIKNAGIRSSIYRLNLFAGTGYVYASDTGAPQVPLIKDKGNAKDTASAAVAPVYVETGPTGGWDFTSTMNGYVDTGLTPSAVFPNANTCHVGVYFQTVPAGFGTWAIIQTGAVLGISTNATLPPTASMFDTGAGVAGLVNAGVGWCCGNRSGAAACQMYERGIATNTSTTAATSLPTITWDLFDTHDTVPVHEYPWLARAAGYSIGLSLAAGQHAVFAAAWQQFQNTLGRAV